MIMIVNKGTKKFININYHFYIFNNKCNFHGLFNFQYMVKGIAEKRCLSLIILFYLYVFYNYEFFI
jgi:hypothetical protein